MAQLSETLFPAVRWVAVADENKNVLIWWPVELEPGDTITIDLGKIEVT